MRSPRTNEWHDWNEWEEIYHEEAERIRQARAPHQDARQLRALRDPVQRTRHELESRQLAARQADRRVRLHPDSEQRQSFREYYESLQHDRRAGRAPRPYVDHNEPLQSRDAPQGSLDIVRQYARQQEERSEPRVDDMPTSTDLYKRRREREAALKEAHVPESASRKEKRAAVKKARTGTAASDAPEPAKPMMPPATVVAGSSRSKKSPLAAEPARARRAKEPIAPEQPRAVSPRPTYSPSARTPSDGISGNAQSNIHKLFASDIWQSSGATATSAKAKGKAPESAAAKAQPAYPAAHASEIPRKTGSQNAETSSATQGDSDDWELVEHSQHSSLPNMSEYESEAEDEFVEVDKNAIEEEMAAKGIDPIVRVKSGWSSWLRR